MTLDYDKLLALPPYRQAREQKRRIMAEALTGLTRHHAQSCPEYARVLSALGADLSGEFDIESAPFLPVRLFKEYDLLSVPKDSVVKTMTSSGTSGQRPSRIFLDSATSLRQTRALSAIVGDFIGASRLPMIILDTPALIKDRAMFSARGAGVLGFSMFGRDRLYALTEDMSLDARALEAFLKKHEGESILLFGFTFMVWRHFVMELKRLDYRPDLSRGVLIHGGGWKKLEGSAVSPADFRAALRDACGTERSHNYYGMVEQTGTIYMECEHGRLHTSSLSDVVLRRARDFSPAGTGERGLIEVISLLPTSYPGHALLTEDEGELLGEDDCPCGRKGKYFRIYGRVKSAETRGCSDTYEQSV